MREEKTTRMEKISRLPNNNPTHQGPHSKLSSIPGDVSASYSQSNFAGRCSEKLKKKKTVATGKKVILANARRFARVLERADTLNVEVESFGFGIWFGG